MTHSRLTRSLVLSSFHCVLQVLTDWIKGNLAVLNFTKEQFWIFWQLDADNLVTWDEKETDDTPGNCIVLNPSFVIQRKDIWLKSTIITVHSYFWVRPTNFCNIAALLGKFLEVATVSTILLAPGCSLSLPIYFARAQNLNVVKLMSTKSEWMI